MHILTWRGVLTRLEDLKPRHYGGITLSRASLDANIALLRRVKGSLKRGGEDGDGDGDCLSYAYAAVAAAEAGAEAGRASCLPLRIQAALAFCLVASLCLVRFVLSCACALVEAILGRFEHWDLFPQEEGASF
jgi:hypothetical protein